MTLSVVDDVQSHRPRWAGRAYQEVSGQPAAANQAAFDIISTDVDSLTSETETLLIMDDLLRALPGMETEPYEIFISHSHRKLYCSSPRIVTADSPDL